MQSSSPPSSKISERVRMYRLEHRSRSRKTLLGSLRELYYQAKYRAQRKGIRCEIDYEYLVHLYHAQNGLCAMSGAEMTYEKRTRHSVWENWANMSLDRIDSSVGYIPGNVHLVCVSINVMKNDLPMPLFVNLCRKIVDLADSAGPEHVLNMTPNEMFLETSSEEAMYHHDSVDFIDYSPTETLVGLWNTRAERRSPVDAGSVASSSRGADMEASDLAASSSSTDQSSAKSPNENMQVY